MRFYFLLASVLITVSSSAQIATASLHELSWAAGQCCASGTNYTVSITILNKDWLHVDSISVCYPLGKTVMAINEIKSGVHNDSTKTFTIYLQHQSDSRYPIDIINIQQPIQKGCDVWEIILMKGKEKQRVEITKKTFEILAYP